MRKIVIVGGGVIGTSVAWHLAERGLGEVTLLERDRLGSGTTWHSAGNITWKPVPDSDAPIEYMVDLIPHLEREAEQSTGWLSHRAPLHRAQRGGDAHLRGVFAGRRGAAGAAAFCSSRRRSAGTTHWPKRAASRGHGSTPFPDASTPPTSSRPMRAPRAGAACASRSSARSAVSSCAESGHAAWRPTRGSSKPTRWCSRPVCGPEG